MMAPLPSCLSPGVQEPEWRGWTAGPPLSDPAALRRFSGGLKSAIGHVFRIVINRPEAEPGVRLANAWGGSKRIALRGHRSGLTRRPRLTRCAASHCPVV